MGEQEGLDYVNAEVDLVTLGCFGGSVLAHGLDAGVVKEDVELNFPRGELLDRRLDDR